MPTAISDGAGRGILAAVDSNHRLEVHAQLDDRYEAINTGKSWSMTFEAVDPAGADDYFVYCNNTSTTETYVFTDLRIHSTVAGTVVMEKVSGTAVYGGGGTDLDRVSRNLSSNLVPTGTYKSDTDITGLTAGGTLFTIYLKANDRTKLTTSAGVIIPPSTSFALKWSEATGVLSGTVSITRIAPEV